MGKNFSAEKFLPIIYFGSCDAMIILLDGRALASRLRQKIQTLVLALPATPGMAVILVGDDPPSHLYVNLKEKACKNAGIRFEKYLYPSSVPEETLIDKIQELNGRADIHGILVQLPLPKQNEDRVIAAIHPNKDLDGFHPESLHRLEHGQRGLVSPAALGIMKLLEATGESIEQKRVVIVANKFFARPIVHLLKDRRPSCVVVLSAHDKNLKAETMRAKLIITAMGIPGFIKGDMIIPGSILIDVGTTKMGNRVIGDVDRASVEPIAGWLTPVPGGVGPVTVAMLLVNVLKAYRIHTLSSCSDKVTC